MTFALPALLISLLFGSIGLGIFLYARRQVRMLLLAVGLALMIYPYFVSSWRLSLAIGTLLTAGAAAICWLRLDL
jgi:hypothetical protein